MVATVLEGLTPANTPAPMMARADFRERSIIGSVFGGSFTRRSNSLARDLISGRCVWNSLSNSARLAELRWERYRSLNVRRAVTASFVRCLNSALVRLEYVDLVNGSSSKWPAIHQPSPSPPSNRIVEATGARFAPPSSLTAQDRIAPSMPHKEEGTGGLCQNPGRSRLTSPRS